MKVNPKGQIARHIRDRFAIEADDMETLVSFANRAACRGDAMVAVVHNSRMSDSYYAQWSALHIPFRTAADLYFEDLKLIPDNFHGLAIALHHRPDFWQDEDRVRADLELEAHTEDFIASNLAMLRAHAAVIDAYLSGELVLGVDPVPRRAVHGVPDVNELDQEQWRVVDAIGGSVTLSQQLADPDYMEEVGYHYDRTQVMAVLGPAGSGKSTAVQVAVRQALANDARVVIACPTRMLVASLREKMPGVDIDSVHSTFQLHKDEQVTLDAMVFFDLIVIEEVSQLSCAVFERLTRLWDAAGKRPTLVFVGDFAQLRGVEPTRATDSLRWSSVHLIRLHTMRRCKCDELKWKLELLRTAKPSQHQLLDILRGHRAVRGFSEVPTPEEIAHVFRTTPDTTLVTISRAGTATMNELAVGALFHGVDPIEVLPGDPEANPANFQGTEMVERKPMDTPIFFNMRITLTRNINKEMDYVNGMGGTVLGVHRTGLRVRTDSGFTIMVFPWTDEHHQVFYPIRLGYAQTLMKIQGMTLKHLTMYLDVANVEACHTYACTWGVAPGQGMSGKNRNNNGRPKMLQIDKGSSQKALLHQPFPLARQPAMWPCLGWSMTVAGSLWVS